MHNVSGLNGKWAHLKDENFEAYLKECGYGWFHRKMATNMKVDLEISIQFDHFVMRQVSGMNTVTVECTLDKEYEETLLDGRKFMTTLVVAGENRLESSQKATKPSDKSTKGTRYLADKDTMIFTGECNGVKCTRTYKRKQ